LRIQLPKSNYKAEVWSKSQKKFVSEDNYDIIEQLHFTSNSSNDGATILDYTMFIDVKLEPNEVGFVKIVKTDKPFTFNAESQPVVPSASSMEISGFTEQNEALF